MCVREHGAYEEEHEIQEKKRSLSKAMLVFDRFCFTECFESTLSFRFHSFTSPILTTFLRNALGRPIRQSLLRQALLPRSKG